MKILGIQIVTAVLSFITSVVWKYRESQR